MQTLYQVPVAGILSPVSVQRAKVRDPRRLSWRLAESRCNFSANVRAPQKRKGGRKQMLVRCGNEDELFLDDEVEPPPYRIYIDPNTGEPAPAYGARPQIPNMQFWGEDMVRVTKSAQAVVPKKIAKKKEGAGSATRGRPRTSRRKSEADKARVGAEKAQAVAAVVAPDVVLGPNGRRPNPFLEDSSDEEEEEEEEEGEAKVAKVEVLSVEESKEAGAGERSDATVSRGRRRRNASKTEPRAEDQQLVLSRRDEGPIELGEQMQHLSYPDPDSPLKNDELWWNWRRPEPGQEPWSAWQKRTGDSDTVMAAAMAEIGQIKLFGEKPTIAEASLARARRRVFYEDRMQAEEERKNEIGPMAYYSEWVKAWTKDTSKAAVQKHFEVTGEDLITQLMTMFSHQTQEEYRYMMGTDIRIRRDPLIMRMRPEQIKQVWGGDPVYPTINYERDPNCIVDYRGENFHEPTPDIVEVIRKAGRLITREELRRIQELEKAQDQEDGLYDDGMSGAVDIGDKDDDEEDEEEDADANEDDQDDQGAAVRSLLLSSKVNKNTVKTLFLKDGEESLEALTEEDDDSEDT